MQGCIMTCQELMSQFWKYWKGTLLSNKVFSEKYIQENTAKHEEADTELTADERVFIAGQPWGIVSWKSLKRYVWKRKHWQFSIFSTARLTEGVGTCFSSSREEQDFWMVFINIACEYQYFTPIKLGFQIKELLCYCSTAIFQNMMGENTPQNTIFFSVRNTSAAMWKVQSCDTWSRAATRARGREHSRWAQSFPLSPLPVSVPCSVTSAQLSSGDPWWMALQAFISLRSAAWVTATVTKPFPGWNSVTMLQSGLVDLWSRALNQGGVCFPNRNTIPVF